MSSNALSLARPYARAAFSLADEHRRLRAWSSLLAFSAAVAADERVTGLLAHPSVDSEALIDLLLPNGESDPNYRQFLTVLAESQRLALLPQVAQLFEKLRYDAERVVKVQVTSAAEMSSEQLEQLAESLRMRFDRQVEMSHRVDESLIGGAIIDAGDVVIDGSIRSKLARLQTTLAH